MPKTPWQQQKQILLRQAAAEVLAAVGRHAPLDLVIELLDDPEPWIRYHALSALSAYGQSAPIERVLRVLSNRDETDFVRDAALNALGMIGTDDAIRIVRAYAERRDDAFYIRWSAIRTLGEYVARPSVELQAEVIAIAHEELPSEEEFYGVYRGSIPQSAAIHALKCWAPHLKYDERLVQRLIEFAVFDVTDLWWCKDEAAEILKTCPAESGHVEQLINIWQRDAHLDRRQSAAYILEWVTAPVPLTPFIECLYDQSREIRLVATSMLGRRYPMGDAPRALVLKHLLPLIDDPDEMIRWYAIMALGELGHEAPSFVLETLDAIVRGDDDWRRGPAIWLLSRLGPQAPIDSFVEALRKDHGFNRVDLVEAMEALREAGARVPITTLVDILLDVVPVTDPSAPSSRWARVLAAQVLGKLGAHAPIEALIQAAQLEDTFENSYIRAEALKALCKLGDRAPLDVIVAAFNDETDTVRMAAQACIHLGERAPVDALLAAVGDGSIQVRQAALDVLKQVAPEALLIVMREAEAILRGDEQAAHYLAPLLGKLTI